jgi:hypothetical protein
MLCCPKGPSSNGRNAAIVPTTIILLNWQLKMIFMPMKQHRKKGVTVLAVTIYSGYHRKLGNLSRMEVRKSMCRIQEIL